MEIATSTIVTTPGQPQDSTTRKHIRGSSLLLVGRLMSKTANLVSQVLIVRCLTQSDYGAFAYAFAVVTLAKTLITFGLDRAITRFVPIYREQRDHEKLVGMLLFVTATILALGAATVLIFVKCQHFLEQWVIRDSVSCSVLLVLIFVAPVQAIDELILAMFAALAAPRQIFMRRHILGPMLKLAIVIFTLVTNGSVFVVASGYLIATLIGVLIYTPILLRMLHNQLKILTSLPVNINVPWREILAFTLPLLTSDLVFVLMNTTDALMLQFYQGTEEVATLRAVQPAAKLNQLVMASFATLFTPMAARFFARKDWAGINSSYWHTAIWVAILSFPIFALTFSLAAPITMLLYGDTYEQSAVILALLAFGYYFNAALGFNGLTLKVYGILSYIVTINVVVGMFNVAINLVLIPRYGAVGAAAGTCSTLVLHNLFKQAGLLLRTSITFFESRYLRAYLIILFCAMALLGAQLLGDLPLYLNLSLASLTCFLVVRLNRDLLNVREMFPELFRIPLVPTLLGN